MVKRNDIVEGKIQFMEADQGVFYIEDQKIVCKHVLLDEVVEVKLTNKIKEGFMGYPIEIKEASPLRNKTRCPAYENCGACALLHMNYDKQCEVKKQEIAKKTKLRVHDMVKMNHPYHYRNKMILGFKQMGSKIVAGLYEENSHKIVVTKNCLMHDDICSNIVKTMCELMMDMKILPYREDSRKGLIRHVVIRKGFSTNEILLTIVTSSPVFPNRNNFVRTLVKKYPEISSVVQNINGRNTSIVLGEEERVLYGSGYIKDILCGKTVQISSKSFYQINSIMCEKLYAKAIELLEPKKSDTILDAYCGIGTIGLSFSEQVKEVIGVELNKQAVKDARINAKLNHVDNIYFVNADATNYMSGAAQEKSHFDAVIMDPPRSGSTIEFIRAINALNVPKVVYISCDPMTQIRDIKEFEKCGYATKELFLFDMFPHSEHTESVCLLTKKK